MSSSHVGGGGARSIADSALGKDKLRHISIEWQCCVCHMLIMLEPLDSQLSCKVDSHIYTSGERKPEEETHLQPFHLETRAVWGKRRPSATPRSKFRPAPEEPPPPTRSGSQIQASHCFMGWKNKGERQRGERKSENNGRNPQRKRQTERWEAHSCGSWKILDHTLKKQQMTDAKLFLEKRVNKERVIFRNITVTDTSKESETSSRLWSTHHVLFQQARVC